MPVAPNRFATLTLLGAALAPLLALPGGVHATLLEPTIAQGAAPSSGQATKLESEWSRIYIRDVYVRDAVAEALDGAAEWLTTTKCRSLLTEFLDQHGRPLQQTLQVLNVTLSDYLHIVVFADGETRTPCVRGEVLAFTAAGSRVVRVCGRVFAKASQRDRREARATIVHEVLHSLGLGENPPTARYITYRVKQLCW